MRNWYRFVCSTIFAIFFVSGVQPVLSAATGSGDGGGVHLPGEFWLVILAPIVSLVFAWWFYRSMMEESEGTEDMRRISQHVKDGARTYLRTQYRVVAVVFFLLMIVLGIIGIGFRMQPTWIPFLFLSGGVMSCLAGWIGMVAATQASARTTHACRSSLNEGLRISFRSGGVMGLTVVGLGLLPIALWFVFLTQVNLPWDGLLGMGIFPLPITNLQAATTVMLPYMMGASLAALFARVGGGIYTKAADVGADIVGKVEEDIPEDDPRNPGTIADNVGDNVGDVAGMGADLYESYCGSILATMVLAVTAGLGIEGVIAPLLIAALGILLSIIGIYLVRTGEEASHSELMDNLMFGINTSSVLTLLASLGVFYLLFYGLGVQDVESLRTVYGETFEFSDLLRLWSPIFVGVVAAVLIGYVTGYYTSDQYEPTQGIAQSAETGTATVIVDGIAVGMASSGWTLLLIVIGVLIAFTIPGGFTHIPIGLYGVGISAVGMLSTLGITNATDAYGPIADNAGGNAEMAELPSEVRERTDLLDSLGNTTAATGKGYAIGSAAMTALALLAAYIQEVREVLQRTGWEMAEIASQVGSIPQFIEYFGVSLMNPRVLLGIMIGGMTVFLFSSMTMRAVNEAAGEMIKEIRKQFKEHPEILEGKRTPEYNRPIEISTLAAQWQMIPPTLVAIFVPVLTSIFLGIGGIMGLLTGTISTGFLVAIMMANSGGAWDNAKKYIEADHFGGKNSPAHDSSIVGDTVGDPFKDTTGPSINILIKLMSIVSVIFAWAAYAWGEEGIITLLNMHWPG
jgi:K(+)-stimulated pyrophosphate-energized sodium pump